MAERDETISHLQRSLDEESQRAEELENELRRLTERAAKNERKVKRALRRRCFLLSLSLRCDFLTSTLHSDEEKRVLQAAAHELQSKLKALVAENQTLQEVQKKLQQGLEAVRDVYATSEKLRADLNASHRRERELAKRIEELQHLAASRGAPSSPSSVAVAAASLSDVILT